MPRSTHPSGPRAGWRALEAADLGGGVWGYEWEGEWFFATAAGRRLGSWVPATGSAAAADGLFPGVADLATAVALMAAGLARRRP